MSRLDPSRMKLLRDRFAREFIVRFNKFEKAVIKLIEVDDAFGLRDKVTNVAWKGLRTDKQLKAFEKWMKTQIAADIHAGNYWEEYINEAYRRGTERAFVDANKYGLVASDSAVFVGAKGQFIRTQLMKPTTVGKVKMLASRTFTDLTGVTSTMSTQMSRVLVNGLTQGDGIRVLSKNMSDRIGAIGRTRAETIARTELSVVHNEAQLDAFEALGLDELGIMVEWQTARKPCPLCEAMKGVVVKTSEARGMIPRHPRCLCVFIPAMVGEDDDSSQKKPQGKIQGSIDKSVQLEQPKRRQQNGTTLAAEKRASRWAGATAKISKNRGPTSKASKKKKKK